MKQDSTYYLDGNVIVNPGDSLGVSPGATIIATGNFNIEIAGTLICNGTSAKPITFTTNDPHAYDSLGLRGSWGGILVDSSSKYVSVTFTHINYTGGPDAEEVHRQVLTLKANRVIIMELKLFSKTTGCLVVLTMLFIWQVGLQLALKEMYFNAWVAPMAT
jgi:hypothetical protein